MMDDAGEQKRSLDTAFVGGLGWTAGAKWATQLITWACVLIVARILTPADFGTVDMAGFYLGLTNILAEFGVGTAVLQMRELEREALGEMKTVSLMFSAAAFAVSLAVAPLVASFFHTGELRLLLVVGSMMLFFSAIQAVPLGLLQRDMDYRRLAISEMVMAAVQGAVTVGCAVAGFRYWALLVGVLAGKATYAAMTSYWKPVPYAMPRWRQVMAPLRFGFEVATARLAWAAYTQCDAIIVGRVLGTSALGPYRFAINFASIPAEKIGTLIMRVTGPLFARIQDDKALVRRYFLIINEMLTLVIFPLAFGMAIVAPDLVRVVLGSKWSAAVGPMQCLALFMAFRDTSTLFGQILTSQRQTRFLMWISILNFVVMPVSFYFASRWGATAIAAAWIVMTPVTVLPTALRLLRTIDCSLREYILVLTPPILGSVAMAGAVLALKAWLLPATWPALGRLTAQVAVGGVAYAAVLLGPYRSKVLKYVRFFLQLRKQRDALGDKTVSAVSGLV